MTGLELTYYVTMDDPEVLIICFHFPSVRTGVEKWLSHSEGSYTTRNAKGKDDRLVPPCPVYGGCGAESGVSCLRAKQALYQPSYIPALHPLPLQHLSCLGSSCKTKKPDIYFVNF